MFECNMVIRKNDRVMEEVNNQLSRPNYFCLPKDTAGDGGGTVIKVPCYKSGGHWFDSRWCHWNFSLT